MTALAKLDERAAFMRYVEKTATCWLWRGSLNKGGYGTANTSTGARNAHRVSYEIHRGPIPPGLDLDHLCRVRRCVNPEHLEPVTRSENLRRGLTGHHVAVAQLAKTHCPRGHAYDDVNTYRNRRGSRSCKRCMRQATREWRARQAVRQ